MIILIFLLIVYIIQVISVLISVSQDVYSKKSEVLIELIPFYWVGWLINGFIKGIWYFIFDSIMDIKEGWGKLK